MLIQSRVGQQFANNNFTVSKTSHVNVHPNEFNEFKKKNVHINTKFAQAWETAGSLDMGQNVLCH